MAGARWDDYLSSLRHLGMTEGGGTGSGDPVIARDRVIGNQDQGNCPKSPEVPKVPKLETKIKNLTTDQH